MIAVMAAPHINKQSTHDTTVNVPKVVRIQLIEEIPEPHLDKQEVVAQVAVAKSKPTQNKPTTKGCETYRAEIAKYNWNVNVALAVMKAESSCNTNAVGDNYPIRGVHAPSCGLFQVRTLKGRPSCSQLKDPATNIAWAYKLYGASGWQPWSVCRTTVRCY